MSPEPVGAALQARWRSTYVAGHVLLAALAVVIVSVGHRDPSPAFWPLAALALVYAAVLPPPLGALDGRRAEAWRVAADIVLLCALAASSGGPRSPVQFLLCAIPLGVALRMPPADVALVGAVTIASAAVAWMAYVIAGHGPSYVDRLVVLALALAWTALVAIALATEYQRRAASLREVTGSLERLTRQMLAAETRERRQVAEVLHDDALQVLLATGQDMREALDGSPSALHIADQSLREATLRLRETIAALQPTPPDAAGLARALRTIADQAGERGGFATHIDADVLDRPVQADLIISLTRELIRNAERHATPGAVAVELRRDGDRHLLRVHDNGRGIGDVIVRDLRERMGDGLALAAQRVLAAGGALDIVSGPEGGTTVAVSLPAAGDGAARPDGPSPPGLPPRFERTSSTTSTQEPHQP